MKHCCLLLLLFTIACSSGTEILKEKTVINNRKVDIPERTYSGVVRIVSDSIPETALNRSNNADTTRNTKSHIRVRGRIDTASNTIVLDVLIPTDSIVVSDTSRTVEKKEIKEVTNYKTTFYIIILLLVLMIIILYFIKK